MDRSWLLVEDRWYGRMVTELGISNIMWFGSSLVHEAQGLRISFVNVFVGFD